MNFPSRVLRFALEGWRDAEKPTEPEDIAKELAEWADDYYVHAEDVWTEDDPLDDDDAQEMHNPDDDEPQP